MAGHFFDNLGAVGWAFLIIELCFLVGAVAVGMNMNKMGKQVAGFAYVVILVFPWLAAASVWLYLGGAEVSPTEFRANSNSTFGTAAQIFVLTSIYSLLAMPLMVGLMYISKTSQGDPAP